MPANSSLRLVCNAEPLGLRVALRLEPIPALRATGARDTALLEYWFYGCLVPRLYNQVRPHSSLGYLTPEEFRKAKGHANVESKQRFPHLHSPDGGYESNSRLNSISEALSYLD